MKQLLPLLVLLHGTSACISTSPRSFAAGPNVQFGQPVAPAFQPAPGAAGAGAFPRPVVLGEPAQPALTPIGAGQSRQSSVLEYLLGHRITLSEFTADGYNTAGGGPVNSGSALSCRVDGTPCCWANVPPPDDQLDWQIATGEPDVAHFQNVPHPEGSYLVAYARGAAPSDEAQFASCSIACASSPITVRAKHWQSENVLLQVCQRESFPQSANFNPLLNCQEFPLVTGLATTEVILPKASLVDIVFVASNFVGENGDMAILDDIELSYDSKGEECQQDNTEQVEESKETAVNSVEESREETQGAHRLTIETNAKGDTASLGNAELKSHIDTLKNTGSETGSSSFNQHSFRSTAQQGSLTANQQQGTFSQSQQQGVAPSETLNIDGLEEEVPQEIGVRAAGKPTFKESVKGPKGHLKVPSTEDTEEGGDPEPLNPAKPPCQATSCTFEQGNTCHYQDAHQTQSIRGLTTRFQVVTGQFMNKITGVKRGLAGKYYAATFLFPREMAGIESVTEPFQKSSRIRFHYYESTHGVQLKACCGSIDDCAFQSDKFVSVDDRVWKTGSLECPEKTEKVIFVCENTRTNQGACAIDDIEMITSEGNIETANVIC